MMLLRAPSLAPCSFHLIYHPWQTSSTYILSTIFYIISQISVFISNLSLEFLDASQDPSPSPQSVPPLDFLSASPPSQSPEPGTWESWKTSLSLSSPRPSAVYSALSDLMIPPDLQCPCLVRPPVLPREITATAFHLISLPLVWPPPSLLIPA